MSNFFAALDSDDEGKAPAPVAAKKKDTSAPKKPVVQPSKVEKRPNKNDRNTRGGRGGRPPVRDGKRQFDRRSGTGRGKEMKKGGGGGHNWGSDQNDAKKAEGPVTEGKEDANSPEGKDPAAEEEAVAEPEPEPEPEDKTMSYEEYMATKARPDAAAFKALEIREVENEFAGKEGVKAEESDFLTMGGGKSLRKKGTGKKHKEKLVLDFKVKRPSSDGDRDGGRRDGRRDSGGRRDNGGRGRGDRSQRGEGRGGDRAKRSSNKGPKSNLDTSDASAFPTL
ncbi:hypothetical protein THAOC_03384 [Thalassiosira oceanica]|uniref:Hyaluronan/mRNA-binding protein domain-containing protein n=1 Tax=Thalassiosira oceanica TaxID=159749 RepID=K0TPU6_THAOC|nr:hypothetical protein THAOC_03384 [Thalassiosira oceanica]|mmetsp:Transcript_31048/g.74030  ORF Transcript_31048/g.74030 Transcript_31048/m.74030 type:complete len:280 (-) Transcript_31048:188-1027(-)|eukprot:EJK74912.1 hypothetical protein THAOC_03384 [Thalassiosira oceanica]